MGRGTAPPTTPHNYTVHSKTTSKTAKVHGRSDLSLPPRGKTGEDHVASLRHGGSSACRQNQDSPHATKSPRSNSKTRTIKRDPNHRNSATFSIVSEGFCYKPSSGLKGPFNSTPQRSNPGAAKMRVAGYASNKGCIPLGSPRLFLGSLVFSTRNYGVHIFSYYILGKLCYLL